MSITKRGLASMRAEQRTRIAKLGGKAAHKLGVAHEWTKETAKVAGQKGGLASAAARKLRKAIANA